jgi:hypothetical protein
MNIIFTSFGAVTLSLVRRLVSLRFEDGYINLVELLFLSFLPHLANHLKKIQKPDVAIDVSSSLLSNKTNPLAIIVFPRPPPSTLFQNRRDPRRFVSSSSFLLSQKSRSEAFHVLSLFLKITRTMKQNASRTGIRCIWGSWPPISKICQIVYVWGVLYRWAGLEKKALWHADVSVFLAPTPKSTSGQT